jgi:hypothetical protein
MAALLVAEVGVLALVAWSASARPTFGVFVREGAASISVSDQRNVVHDITVDRVVSPVPGWLLVQADGNQGVPDGIIGSRWIPAGESQKVSIAVGPAPLPKRIYVTLLADLGKPHVLEYAASSHSTTAAGGIGSIFETKGVAGANTIKDKPVIAGGSPVTAHVDMLPLNFAVGPSQAYISESTRTLDATTVVIPRIVAPAQSWVSLNLEAASGQTGGVLGTKLVAPGEHKNVVVPLNVRLGPSPVIATLHVDLGTLGRFDFSPLDLGDSLDQPYVAGGRTVSAPVHYSQ